MATAQIGKSCGRFGKRLFPPLTLSLPSLCVVIDWREVTFKMKSRSVRKNVKAFMLSHGININSPLLSPPSSLFAYSPLLYPFLFSIVSLAQWLCSLSISFLSLRAALSFSALCLLLDCLSMCLRLCARVLTRETEREREGSSECVLTHAFVCVRACRGACWQTEVGGGTD